MCLLSSSIASSQPPSTPTCLVLCRQTCNECNVSLAESRHGATTESQRPRLQLALDQNGEETRPWHKLRNIPSANVPETSISEQGEAFPIHILEDWEKERERERERRNNDNERMYNSQMR